MKRFVHFSTKAAFNTATLGTEYDNESIVFIKDSLEIWTHGQFYAIPEAYKNKITSLELAVAALQQTEAKNFAFRKVSDGTTTFTTASGKETLTFAAGANTSVAVDSATGKVTIGSTLTANSYYPNASGTALAGRVDTLEDNAIQTITGTDAVDVTGTGTSRTVALKLNNTGKNVTLELTAEGLSAQVTNVDALVPVDGIASGDKVLTLTSKKIGATVKLAIDSTADDSGKKYIRLTGANNSDLGKIDIAEFVKDGMLDGATFNESNHVLTLTFNTASGKEDITVNLASLVDVYDGSKLKLKSIAIPTTDAVEPADNDTVDSAVANLIKKDRELQDDFDALNTTVTGLNTNSLTGIKKGTDGQFVTTTVSTKANKEQSIGVAVKSDVAIANATTTNNSLATSLAVKTYVDDMFAWAEY